MSRDHKGCLLLRRTPNFLCDVILEDAIGETCFEGQEDDSNTTCTFYLMTCLCLAFYSRQASEISSFVSGKKWLDMKHHI